MEKKEAKLGEILTRKGALKAEDLKDALKEQVLTKEFLGDVLIRKGYVKEVELMEALSSQFNMPFKRLDYAYIDWKFVSKFDPSLVFDCKCVPLKEEKGIVEMAITNPLDVWVLEAAEKAADRLKVHFALITEDDAEDVIKRYKIYLKGRYISS